MNNIEIRHAVPDDASRLIDYLLELFGESDNHLLTGPGEFKYTVQEEKNYIEEMTASENSVVLLAFSGKELIGEVNLQGGRRKAEKHTAVLGISVRKGWHGRGIGTRLMQTLLEWARMESPLERIELRVFSENQAAIHIYQKLGFVVEGRRRKSICKKGRYLDDLLMALLLDEY